MFYLACLLLPLDSTNFRLLVFCFSDNSSNKSVQFSILTSWFLEFCKFSIIFPPFLFHFPSFFSSKSSISVFFFVVTSLLRPPICNQWRWLWSWKIRFRTFCFPLPASRSPKMEGLRGFRLNHYEVRCEYVYLRPFKFSLGFH